MKREMRRNRKSTPISLRSHLAWYMLIFLSIVLMTTWLFQVGLLDVVYEKVRERDMEQVGERIAAAVGSDTLEDVVYHSSMDELMEIAVYRIDGGRAIRITANNFSGDSEEAPSITNRHMAGLYKRAVAAGGSLHTQLTFGGHEAHYTIWDKLFPKSNSDVERGSVSMVYTMVWKDSAENEYMLLLNTSLEPLVPMVHTLQRQFVWIFGILSVITVLFSFIVSRQILNPIVHMNNAAKKLASGNYDADFDVRDGYRETKELASTLSYATKELARTDQLQKELIANISHDLRTPLTMIRGYGEVMRDIPGENTPENVQVLIDEADRLSELVSDLMDLSKIQSGVHRPEMEFFNLTAAVKEVLQRYETFTKGQGYQINFERLEEVFVFADRGMILQVLYNLISNAVHYTGDNLSVTVTQTVENGNVRISVKDTGMGIPQDQLPYIWDRYYKVDKVHRRAKIGTGLGLSIVKGILTVHNAEFGVESEVGTGSDFWFVLPVSDPPESAPILETKG